MTKINPVARDSRPRSTRTTSGTGTRAISRREMRRVFEICHNCRMCVGYCGSFPDLFARVDRDIEKRGADGRRAARRRGLSRASTDLCWQCKLCYVKCPYTPDEGHEWLVDVPRLLDAREGAARAAQRRHAAGSSARRAAVAGQDDCRAARAASRTS